MNYQEFLKTKGRKVQDVGFEGQGSNPKLFDWQNDVVRWALRKGRAAIFSACGTGKGQPFGSKVLSESGWKAIETLCVGERVYASDGNLHNVTGVYRKGELDTYRFFYGDGTSLVFDKDHLHIVRTQSEKSRDKPWRVMSTTELLNAKLRYGNNGQSRNYCVPLAKPIQHEHKDFIVHPYVLGALIGNGYINGNIKFSSADMQTIESVRAKLPDGVELVYDRKYDYKIMTGCIGPVRHQFREEIVRLGLWGKHSDEKFIPDEYMNGSVEQRIELLRGLMDTDGCILQRSCQYNTASERLAKGVLSLAWSLGGYGTISKKKAGYRKDGEYIPCKDSYTVFIAFEEINPFSLERKASKWRPHARDIGRYIDRIEYEGMQRTVCIAVDSPDHSYITENYLVTHNTSIQLQWANEVAVYTGKPVLILAPLAVAQQTKREGEKFGIPATVCRTQKDCTNGLNITNYEMMEHFESGDFWGGIVLDESSAIKHKDSKTRNALQEKFRDTQFKLCCTATPAPNDYMELGTHSEFLGVMKQTEMQDPPTYPKCRPARLLLPSPAGKNRLSRQTLAL